MRMLLLATLLLGLSASSGCMVLDEVDKANAQMASASKSKTKTETAPPNASATAQQKKNALLEQSKQWWDRATSLAPGEVKASIVGCRLREGTQFMSKDDCLSRGGQPQGVSG